MIPLPQSDRAITPTSRVANNTAYLRRRFYQSFCQSDATETTEQRDLGCKLLTYPLGLRYSTVKAGRPFAFPAERGQTTGEPVRVPTCTLWGLGSSGGSCEYFAFEPGQTLGDGSRFAVIFGVQPIDGPHPNKGR